MVGAQKQWNVAKTHGEVFPVAHRKYKVCLRSDNLGTRVMYCVACGVAYFIIKTGSKFC